MTRGLGSLVLLGCITATPLWSQGYRLQVDSRIQSVAFRGVTPDSVAAIDVVVGETGGFETSDGFAVRCRSGAVFCHFYRAGEERRGGPLVTAIDLSAWGFGLRGLRVHAAARLGVDVGDVDVWPGTNPALQLLEAYLEYHTPRFTAELGRSHVTSRFGYTGFDGVKVTIRPLARGLAATVYGGYGLARGVALPVTSPALDPLDDFQPRDRQLLVGASVSANLAPARIRALYQREVDPRSDNFVSERAGFDVATRSIHGFSLRGGADYDLAAGWWGTAEAALAYTEPRERVRASVGARRYRPYFELWTIWGAFNPVPHRAAFGAITVRPHVVLRLRARGEMYEFEAAEAGSPLTTVEEAGWRWSVGGTFRPIDELTVAADYHAEFGPGAASLGFDGTATWRLAPSLSVTGSVASLLRPLEFRFNEANVLALGLDARYEVNDHVALSLGLRHYDEERDRPDAAAFQWDQLRVSGGIRVAFGSGADVASLPPAILRIPTRRDSP